MNDVTPTTLVQEHEELSPTDLSDTPRLTAQEIKQRLTDGVNFLLVDLMPPSQYLLVHIPGAISIPLEYLHDVIPYLPHNREIVLYCTNEECEFSEIGAKKLRLHGFRKVAIFGGGLAAWEQAGYIFATILLNTEPEEPSMEPPAEQPEPEGGPVGQVPDE